MVLAAANDPLAIACSAFSRLAAAGNHEAGGLAVGNDGEGKSVQRRLRGRIDGRTDVAARNRVHLAVEQPPFLERHDIALVECAKALLGKLRGRAQLARDGVPGQRRDAADAAMASARLAPHS